MHLKFIFKAESFTSFSKIGLAMRLTGFFLLVCLMQASAATFGQTVTLHKKDASLKEILKDVRAQTGFNFIYSNRTIRDIPTLTISGTNMDLKEVLEKALLEQGLTYSINKKVIVLKKEERPLPAKEEEIASEPERQITGTVVDSTSGEPLAGVTIRVQGTNNGTVTDGEGKFTLTADDNAVLEVSFVGYSGKTVSLRGGTTIHILLSSAATGLDQLVVVGYGVQKKKDLTGSISSINASEIVSVPTTDASEALQGRIPGLNVTQTSSSPGATPNVLLRGKRSVNASNDPLYVVDGVPLTGGIDELNPSDIESINVLKDASATAIYGARGANGVIIVTTKTGFSGKTEVEYNGYIGTQTILNDLDLWNGPEYAELSRAASRNRTDVNNRYNSPVPDKQEDLINQVFTRDPYIMAAVMKGWVNDSTWDPALVPTPGDYRPYVQRAGLVTNHQIAIRGGNDKTTFSLSTTYFKNDGIYKDESYERYGVRLSLNHEINKIFKIETQSQYTHSLQQRGSGFAGDYRVPPLGALKDSSGNLIPLPGSEITYNPLLDLQPGAISNPLKVYHYFGSYALNINLPIEGLVFRSSLGIDSRTTQDQLFQAGNSAAREMGTSFARNGYSKLNMFSLENTLNYQRLFNNKHNLNITFLQSVQENKTESNDIDVEDLPADILKYYDIGAALRVTSRGSSFIQWRLSSYMGRVNYSLLDKYLLTVSARYDGSSRLSPGHKWVLFPSAALAWRASEENFLKEVRWLDNLKLRLGYGRTGNSAVDPYQTLGTLALMPYTFNNGGTNVTGFAPSIMPNKSLTWETTDQWNLGIDFGVLNNRINGTIDFYLQRTHDLLLNRQLPVVSGYSDILTNVGKTRNKGIEISLNSVNIDSKDFKWNTGLTLYSDKEQFVELYGGKGADIGNKWFVGQPVDVFYDYHKIGIWQNTPEDLAEMQVFNENGANFTPGDIKIEDVNGDNSITDEDRIILGNPRPKVLVSLDNAFSYKNFDLSFLLYSSIGAMLYNNIDAMEHVGRNGGAKFDYWTPTNPTNAFPKPNLDEERPLYITSAYYDKADYLKLRSATLGYTFFNGAAGSIRSLRVYFTAKNPFVITNFPGVDPEEVENGGYVTPTVSSWILGVNVKF